VHAQIEPTIPLGVKPVQIQPVKIRDPIGDVQARPGDP
jgi:hypothetical protein